MLGDILEFLGKVPGGIWDLIPSIGGPGWVVTLVKGLVGLSGLTVLTRIVPDKWLYVPITQFFDKLGMAIALPLYAIGKGLSEAGRKLLGKRRWEKVESQVFEKAIGLLFRAIFDGLSLFVQRVRNSLLDGLDADDPGVGNITRPTG